MEYDIRIAGMHCTGCAQSVEQYLSSEPGVTEAAVSYDDGHAKISVSADAEIKQLVNAIERMGYDVTVRNSE